MKQKIKIIGDHPHKDEFAEITVSEEGTITCYMLFGKKKIKAKLIGCIHGDSCFVGEDEFVLI
uniref:Uncharacterized protein n=1 Tax=viral metagenome TaxID=1070528 RepID=A0A6M3LT06_9ZZZZ